MEFLVFSGLVFSVCVVVLVVGKVLCLMNMLLMIVLVIVW